MASFSLVNPNTTTDAASEEKYSIVHFQYNNNELSIRNIPTRNIYNQTLLSRFNFRKGYKIMTVEKNLSLPECKDIYLLSRDEIRTYRSKYQYLHIGLVQFAMVEPASDREHTYIWQGKYRAVSLSVRLRDSKFQNLEDSILTSLKPDYLFGNPVVEVNTKITNFVVPQI
ncbi:hypothetical protein MTR_0116s0010 [Medicago truncatula]|uniref:Uncharacterized protein n=1 Tax=Medicago truncatula TaxID=3880 RepID=A0A072TIE4_MEDTR|nr:hypothetical protein MTR_0116s0010 [Medicago truncatula]